ncbi:hypothetical protein SBY92_002388 [Candida maltosa Xu316]|uniref:Uncharacterized protein n=1 Tax=Candida maltosa (strain Xu316) TaxID=1245528 RepID=M3HPF1_CANMX|nr:hypothetical protein G210_5882 [Candida maltosa Xu316]
MAGTLTPDKEFNRFNIAKEKLGHYFRFKPRSALFNVIFMGAIPGFFFYYAYATEGQHLTDRFRKAPIFPTTYVPRVKQNQKPVSVEEDDDE